MPRLTSSVIEANLVAYITGQPGSPGRTATARYASFDFCFNYFQGFREAGSLSLIATPERVELSCLQLAFYLASWGMLRGSSSLLQKSSRAYEPLIVEIATTSPLVWEIDAHCYTDENAERLLELASVIRRVLPGGASDTLVTKIMLGIFGNVPAFDAYFKKGAGVSSFGAKALRTLGSFYNEFAPLIEKYRVPTIDFATGQETSRRYTRAKVIDMVFFIEGSKPG